MTAVLEVRGLESGYGEMQVLWGVDLTVDRGSITVILGPNGAGKTTLLRTIIGSLAPWRGVVRFEGEDVTRLPPHAKVAMGMGLVPEGRRLFPEMTVYENLILGTYTRRAREKIDDTLELVFTLFPRLKERLHQKAGTLSGGEQQMLAIARSLMTRPKLLMLDEPSQGLAPKLAEEVVLMLKRLRDEAGLTILLVEQNVYLALEYADRGYVLEQGRVVMQGSKDKLLSSERVRKAYLGL